MSAARRFLQFWWEFIVGDDLLLAVGILAAIGLTAALVHAGNDAWWLLPPTVMVILSMSVVRAARTQQYRP